LYLCIFIVFVSLLVQVDGLRRKLQFVKNSVSQLRYQQQDQRQQQEIRYQQQQRQQEQRQQQEIRYQQRQEQQMGIRYQQRQQQQAGVSSAFAPPQPGAFHGMPPENQWSTLTSRPLEHLSPTPEGQSHYPFELQRSVFDPVPLNHTIPHM
jgi:hypothetical protein